MKGSLMAEISTSGWSNDARRTSLPILPNPLIPSLTLHLFCNHHPWPYNFYAYLLERPQLPSQQERYLSVVKRICDIEIA